MADERSDDCRTHRTVAAIVCQRRLRLLEVFSRLPGNASLEAAREHGVEHLIGEVFASNTPMVQLARSLGFRVDFHPEGGALRRVTLDSRSPRP